MKLRLSKLKIIMLLIVFVVMMIIIVNAYNSQHILSTTNHTLTSPKLSQPIRIVQLTDLHNNIFGKDNVKLIETCKAQKPDIILLTGDLVNMDEEDISVAENLISNLKDIAPVYVSMGNHEETNEQNFGTDVTSAYESVGAVVLDREYVDITINNQEIRLGGIYGYCLPAKFLETKEANPEECAFLWDFQETDRYTILMCHMPVCWLINDGLDEWDVDCVFSGHAHGGQIILPFIGGMYAPDMGFFPGNLQGVFSSEDGSKHMVLSRGLGSGTWVPRMNNQPEIVVVDIVNKVVNNEK